MPSHALCSNETSKMETEMSSQSSRSEMEEYQVSDICQVLQPGALQEDECCHGLPDEIQVQCFWSVWSYGLGGLEFP